MTERQTFPLNQIYFYLTEGCNLRCRHCWIAPTYQTEHKAAAALDFDLVRHIVEQAKPLGLSGVKLSGGEPLIHPRISEILDYLSGQDLTLTVETNGVSCTAELAAKIRACKKPFVSVSMDGSDATTHEWMRGVEGCFDAAIKGIRHLVEAGLRPQVIMSLLRRNRNQMAAVVQLAESLGAGSVKFNMVQPTARGERMHESGEALSVEELVEVGQWVETDLATSTSLRLSFSHPVAFRPLNRMFGTEGDGCGQCGILGILGVLGNGSYALCGIGETVPELVFGHAALDRLEDVWNNNAVLLELREGLPRHLQGICGDCLMKRVCLGNCVAQNFYRGKSLWAPHWYCEEASKRDLFPRTRLFAQRQIPICREDMVDERFAPRIF
jgi:SynChlorMet cassette radical SAM/SPASM protein ScmF